MAVHRLGATLRGKQARSRQLMRWFTPHVSARPAPLYSPESCVPAMSRRASDAPACSLLLRRPLCPAAAPALSRCGDRSVPLRRPLCPAAAPALSRCGARSVPLRRPLCPAAAPALSRCGAHSVSSRRCPDAVMWLCHASNVQLLRYAAPTLPFCRADVLRTQCPVLPTSRARGVLQCRRLVPAASHGISRCPLPSLVFRHLCLCSDGQFDEVPFVEELRIVARGQHVQRWLLPRSEYPEGREAYLRWREDLKKMHANTVTGGLAGGKGSREGGHRVTGRRSQGHRSQVTGSRSQGHRSQVHRSWAACDCRLRARAEDWQDFGWRGEEEEEEWGNGRHRQCMYNVKRLGSSSNLCH
eukprot:365661-Chlamydomonas_euryale.AAC.85